MHFEMADAVEELSGGHSVISNVQSATHHRCRLQLCRSVAVSTRLAALTRWKCGIRWTEKSNPNIARHLLRDTLPPGSTQAGHDSYKDLCHTATILAQGTEFGADCQQLCQSRGILPVVTDLETPWQNAVLERHGALFKMAFEKSVQSRSSDDGTDRLHFRGTQPTRGVSWILAWTKSLWLGAAIPFKFAHGRLH